MPRVKPTQPAAPEPELTVELDQETGNIEFQVQGRSIELREPIAKDFMTLEAWMRSDSGNDEDLAIQKRDINFMLIKLAAICSIEKISYQDLCDLLISFEDIERVAAAMSMFQSQLEEYFKRIIDKAAG